ncbi:hypothetical protein G4B88_030205 [Cannabis sativa]|uniref:Uncharacterized protein n=1 Tax=Cannabis sativa TaxID=3483 RepID=A0A7J6EZC9_CANSA|nr:hypothetical protein G4B88_030205 [Cannabis sativa]
MGVLKNRAGPGDSFYYGLNMGSTLSFSGKLTRLEEQPSLAVSALHLLPSINQFLLNQPLSLSIVFSLSLTSSIFAAQLFDEGDGDSLAAQRIGGRRP